MRDIENNGLVYLRSPDGKHQNGSMTRATLNPDRGTISIEIPLDIADYYVDLDTLVEESEWEPVERNPLDELVDDCGSDLGRDILDAIRDYSARADNPTRPEDARKIIGIFLERSIPENAPVVTPDAGDELPQHVTDYLYLAEVDNFYNAVDDHILEEAKAVRIVDIHELAERIERATNVIDPLGLASDVAHQIDMEYDLDSPEYFARLNLHQEPSVMNPGLTVGCDSLLALLEEGLDAETMTLQMSSLGDCDVVSSHYNDVGPLPFNPDFDDDLLLEIVGSDIETEGKSVMLRRLLHTWGTHYTGTPVEAPDGGGVREVPEVVTAWVAAHADWRLAPIEAPTV
jgi:hypothetical protein